jgi:hypothetical protein
MEQEVPEYAAWGLLLIEIDDRIELPRRGTGDQFPGKR